MARKDPRTDFQGSLRIRAPFYRPDCLAVCCVPLRHHKDSVSKAIVLAGILQPSRGLHSHWQVISYFQVMGNHSNSAVFLISSSEWGRCTEATLSLFLGLELLCSRWAKSLVQRDSMKEHLPVFLMVKNCITRMLRISFCVLREATGLTGRPLLLSLLVLETH